MEAEKRIRREIANSNERRRMQSINNGFQSLRSLLPHHEGEKLSKVSGSNGSVGQHRYAFSYRKPMPSCYKYVTVEKYLLIESLFFCTWQVLVQFGR